MKPEPLKDKVYNGNKILKRVYHEEDILNAVEWLKEEVKFRDIPKGKFLVLELIDKAFQDVTKDAKT